MVQAPFREIVVFLLKRIPDGPVSEGQALSIKTLQRALAPRAAELIVGQIQQ